MSLPNRASQGFSNASQIRGEKIQEFQSRLKETLKVLEFLEFLKVKVFILCG